MGTAGQQFIIASMRGRYAERAAAEAARIHGANWPIMASTPTGRQVLDEITAQMLANDPEGRRLFEANIDLLLNRNQPGRNPDLD